MNCDGLLHKLYHGKVSHTKNRININNDTIKMAKI